MMKKTMVISLAAALSCLAPLAAAAASSPAAEVLPSTLAVTWDGEEALLARNAYLVNNHLYAPYQQAATALNAEAKWDAVTKKLTLQKGSVTIELSEGTVQLADSGTAAASAPLIIIGENAYVPVRFVLERFGYRVGYDEAARTVLVTSAGSTAAPAPALAQVKIAADLDPQRAAGMRIEGVTGDAEGRLYTVDMDSRQLFRIDPQTGKSEVLTVLPRLATGMSFGPDGHLYLASGGGQGVDGVILRVPAEALKEGAFDASKVETFVSGVNGANGLAFDSEGLLYVSGGATGNVYTVTPEGVLSTWASGIAAEREEQKIVVNGLAFDGEGRLYIANTSSGEINRVTVGTDGKFGPVEQFAKSPLLYGADGIAFGPDGVLYVCANERNAVVSVAPDGEVAEWAANANEGPLEFPASIHITEDAAYISNFDQPRGANKPNEPGIGSSIAKIEFGAGSQE